jgi:hypothetical protein
MFLSSQEYLINHKVPCDLKKTTKIIPEPQKLEAWKCLVVLTIAIFSFPLGATEVTIKAYDSAPLAKRSEYRGYAIGAFSALGWANAVNENRGSAPFFCVPDDQKISPSLVLNVLESEIKSARGQADSTVYQSRTVTQALIIGLEKRFPCTKPSERLTNNNPVQISPLTETVAILHK